MPQSRPTFEAVLSLIRWDKPYGTLLLLAPALWSLFIAANGTPSLHLVFVFVLGSFLMRSAGCAINDLADYPMDARVDRTKGRPLPSGRLAPVQALAVFIVLSLMAFALIWLLNPLTRVMSVIGITLAVLYPFTKRFFGIPQIFMGTAFGWGSVMAWTAVRDRIEIQTVWVFLATLCWATAYDTIYARMDRQDDAHLGIQSSALLFGAGMWIGVGVLFAMALFFLILTGLFSGLGFPYFAALLIVAGFFIRQVLALRRERNRETLFSMFKSHAGIGFLLLAGILAGYLL